MENKFIKTKFNSDDNLSLNKLLEIHNLTKVVRSVFQEDNKYYSQIFLDECLYELQKILQYERTKDWEGIGINKSSKSKECIICHYWYFENIGCKFEPFAYNKCHDI